MQVYLIRHAQSEGNVLLDEADGRQRMSRATFNALIRRAPESPLTPEGVLQAQRLAERLASVRFARLYSSPLPRARDTAAALAESTGLAPQIIDDLRELMPPPLNERAGDLPLRRLLRLAFLRMFLAPSSSDALRPAYRRARAVWQQMTTEPAEAIAVVSHGWCISFLLLSVWLDRRWRIVSRDLSNTGISLIVSRQAPGEPPEQLERGAVSVAGRAGLSDRSLADPP